MGCVIHSSHKTTNQRTIISGSSTLQQFRSDLISIIYYLHSLSNLCKSEIELCIINKDKAFALLLKGKELCIIEQLSVIRELIGLIDISTDQPHEDQLERNKIIKLTKSCINEVNTNIVYSNKLKILKENFAEQACIQAALKKFNLNTTQLEIEIDHELRMQALHNKKGEAIRKKYKRLRSSI